MGNKDKYRGYKGVPNRSGITRLVDEFNRQQTETKELLLDILESIQNSSSTVDSGSRYDKNKPMPLGTVTSGTSELTEIPADFFSPAV